MDTRALSRSPRATEVADDLVEEIAGALGLRIRPHPRCDRARAVLTPTDSSQVALVFEQGPTFRADKRAIAELKAEQRDLRIIYLATTTQARREMAVRRLGIHYFLAHPHDGEELRLVLEALVRASVTTSFERFLTR